MTSVNLYNVYCTTEGKFVPVWGTSEPTTCPNNNTHEINSSSTSIVQTVSQTTVTVEEPTNGYFQTENIVANIPSMTPGSVYSVPDIKWPIDLLLWRSMWRPTADNIGDSFDIIANPDKIIGVLTAPLTAGTNVLSVPALVSNAGSLIKSVHLSIDDGTHYESLGRVISLDTVANTITLEKNAVNSYAAGSLLKLNLYVAIGMQIRSDCQTVTIGDKGFKGKTVPANTVFRINYTNGNGAAKVMDWRVEYYLI